MARHILDVRSPAEFRAGHSSRAKNLPLDQLKRTIERVARREDEIWLCCESGSRASQAARELRSLGYTRIKEIGPWTKL